MTTNSTYKRLTTYNKEFEHASMTATHGEDTCKTIARHVDRLYELENAIENGTLVFLPCKAGDTVYILNRYYIGKSIEEYVVDRITLTSNKVIFDALQVEPPHRSDLIYSDSWGRNVFFTKEAAEKALEELENDKV